MTDDEIQYKAFLTIWKVLRQGQSEDYFKIEECIRQYGNGEITEGQVAAIYPEGIDAIIKEQVGRNSEMFITALLATSDDKFEKIKWRNSANFRKLREN
ncbi:MAG: hypothetical protein ACTSRW_17870 [Candidatus Helarchaeota archaeon]